MSHTSSFIRAESCSPLAGAAALVGHAVSRAFNAWKRRRRLAYVAELDDHLLADIGLSPHEVLSALPFNAYKAKAALRLLRAVETSRG